MSMIDPPERPVESSFAGAGFGPGPGFGPGGPGVGGPGGVGPAPTHAKGVFQVTSY